MTFPINTSTILIALKGAGILSILGGVLRPTYSITYANNGAPAIVPTSFVGIRVISESTISTAPTEAESVYGKAGGYIAFNKVKMPRTIQVTFTLEGKSGFSGALPNWNNLTFLSRTEMIQQLDAMVSSAQLYDIETPDTTYEGFDLVHYDFGGKRSATLLTVSATFQEVRSTMDVMLSTPTAQNTKTSKSNAKSTKMVMSGTKSSNTSDMGSATNGIMASIPQATRVTKMAETIL
jgi:hypothetical protein